MGRKIASIAVPIMIMGSIAAAFFAAYMSHSERVDAEIRTREIREGTAFKRGKLVAMCEHYCADIDLQWAVLCTPEIDRLEGHVVSIDGEPERCRCMLADYPPRAEEVSDE